MLNKKILSIALSFLVSCDTIAAQAARDSLLLRDYRFVQQSSPWLTQQNAAALVRFDKPNMAEAEVSLTHGNGKLTDFSGSPSFTNLLVAVESYYRINPRTVVYGAISYNNLSGKDMTGSVFIQQRLPFDIVEDSLANAGRKHRDTYQLTGAFGYDLYHGYAIGVRADYTAANYAKYKDLRHQNKLMDLQLTAGLYAPLTTWLDFGFNYTYYRRTESVSFGTYGKGDKVYKSLIDYGAMMGIVEQFGNEGYTDKSNEMPLCEDGPGWGLQFAVECAPFSLYNALSFSSGTGYYGRKSPYTITYTNHDRDVFTNNLRLAYSPLSHTSRFHLDMHYQSEQLHNRANTYRGLTNPNGATYYEYYGDTETADKDWRNLNIDYTMDLGIRHELPTWTVTAGYHFLQRDITAYLYPYYRQQQLRTHEVTASARRNIITRKGIWGISAHAGYQKGDGNPYTDGTFVTPSDKQPQPATMADYLHREYQYLTASQYSVGGSVKYSFRMPGTQLKIYTGLSADYRKANERDSYCAGNHHTQIGVSAGCCF